ncbi:hypothetical protein B0H67DRAFT_451159, partial [Lasiosphaeris hirsuta]
TMPPASPKASTSLPLLCRVTLTTLEPLFAISGALMALRDPNNYISNYLTRGAVAYAPETQPLYTQLAGAWLVFAFIEAVVLRSFDDLRLWRLLCVAMLPSDIAFAYSAAQGVGGWTAYF